MDEKKDPVLENESKTTEKETLPDTSSTTPKRKKGRYILLTVFLSVLTFFCGLGTGWAILGEKTRSFLKVRYLLQHNYYEEIDDETLYDVVFNAINSQLLDDYSKYMTEEEYAAVLQSNAGAQSGTGLSFYKKDVEKGLLRIARVAGNSPAEAAGMQAGNIIVGVGATETAIEACDTFAKLSALMQPFKAGEEFCVKVNNNGEEEIYKVAKKAFTENYVFYRSATTAYRFTGDQAQTLTAAGEPLAALPADTAYICLTQFNGGAAEQFAKAMGVFREENKKNLVLDLRNNGGGSMAILCEIAAYFCKTATDKEPIIAFADYGEKVTAYRADENLYDSYFQKDSRVCVLANHNSASASEALMGSMIDYNATRYEDICLTEENGVAKTYGKGIMQTTIPLGISSDALKITTAKILWPKSSNCIHQRGVLKEDGTKSAAQKDSFEEELQDCIKALFR